MQAATEGEGIFVSEESRSVPEERPFEITGSGYSPAEVLGDEFLGSTEAATDATIDWVRGPEFYIQTGDPTTGFPRRVVGGQMSYWGSTSDATNPEVGQIFITRLVVRVESLDAFTNVDFNALFMPAKPRAKGSTAPYTPSTMASLAISSANPVKCWQEIGGRWFDMTADAGCPRNPTRGSDGWWNLGQREVPPRGQYEIWLPVRVTGPPFEVPSLVDLAGYVDSPTFPNSTGPIWPRVTVFANPVHTGLWSGTGTVQAPSGLIPAGSTDTFSLTFTRTGGPQSNYDLVIRHNLFGRRPVVERAVLTSNLYSASTGEREFWTDPRDANTGADTGLVNKWIIHTTSDVANTYDFNYRWFKCEMTSPVGMSSTVIGRLRKI